MAITNKPRVVNGKLLLKSGRPVLRDDCCCCGLGVFGMSFRLVLSGKAACTCRDSFNSSLRNVALPGNYDFFYTGGSWIAAPAGNGDRWEGATCDSAALQNEGGTFSGAASCSGAGLTVVLLWGVNLGVPVPMYAETFTELGQTRTVAGGCGATGLFSSGGSGQLLALP